MRFFFYIEALVDFFHRHIVYIPRTKNSDSNKEREEKAICG